jgi:hypothetical protein
MDVLILHCQHCADQIVCQSNAYLTQSDVTGDGQSVIMSWCRVQSGICEHILLSV